MNKGFDYLSAHRRRPRMLGRMEWTCWVLAALLVTPQIAAVAARNGLSSAVNDADWSPSRREAYLGLLRQGSAPAPIGRLQLSAEDDGIPIFAGTGEVALTLGAGHLPETGELAGTGNIAIAGHRDGFFRKLRHVRVGDRLTLASAEGERTFLVTDTMVVSPEDVWVLDDTGATILTLITCHPFYYAGHAPDRYVVRARLSTARAKYARR